MANMNDCPLSLSSDSRSSDFAHLVRAEASSSSDSYHLLNTQLVRVIILVPNDSISERLSSYSLGREVSFNEHYYK